MKISVALCTYNGEKHLPALLESLLAQTRQPDEIIACDDLSTDATLQILKDFGERWAGRLNVIANPANLGFLKNFDKAIGLCSGEVILTCDQDDIWIPAKIERIADEFGSQPDVDMIFSDAVLIGEDGKDAAVSLWESVGFTAERRLRFVEGGALREIASRNMVTGAAMALRSRLRTVALPIPTGVSLRVRGGLVAHDAWIAWCAASVSRVLPIAEPLLRYRIHPSQQIGLPTARDLATWKPLQSLDPIGYEQLVEVLRRSAQASDSYARRVAENLVAYAAEVFPQCRDVFNQLAKLQIDLRQCEGRCQNLEQILSSRTHRLADKLAKTLIRIKGASRHP